MFSIDGLEWHYPVDVSREADIRSTDLSGELMNGVYYNDVKGTYFNYTVKMVVPLNNRDSITQYYDALTAPVSSHTFVLPYNQQTVTLLGRVENVSDVYVRLPNGGTYWRGLQFTILASSPTKEVTDASFFSRGVGVLPEAATHNEGDTWVWHDGRWELSASYKNADTTRY